jgi:hypothetical protein
VTGTFNTDIITDAGTSDHRDFSGPYAPHHSKIDRRGRFAMRFARPPERFAHGLAKALDHDDAPFTRHAVGVDARLLLYGNRILPGRVLHQVIRVAMGIPRQGALHHCPATRSEHDG